MEARGQTKICEDAFQRLRDREDRDVRNRRLEAVKMFSCLRGERVFALHKRKEAEPPEGPGLPSGTKELVPMGTCYAHKQECSVDAKGIQQRATWPTFTAQTPQGLAVEGFLLRHCKASDTWTAAGGSLAVAKPSWIKCAAGCEQLCTRGRL